MCASYACLNPSEAGARLCLVPTGLGFRVKGLGFRVWGLGFRVWRLTGQEAES